MNESFPQPTPSIEKPREQETILRAERIFEMIDKEELKKVFIDIIKKTDAPKHRYENDFPSHLPSIIRRGEDTAQALVEERFSKRKFGSSSNVSFVTSEEARGSGRGSITHLHRDIEIVPEKLIQENFNHDLLRTYVHETTHIMAMGSMVYSDGVAPYGEMGATRGSDDYEAFLFEMEKDLPEEYKNLVLPFVEMTIMLDEALTEYITDAVTTEYIRRTGDGAQFGDTGIGSSVEAYSYGRKILDSFIDGLSEISGFDKETVTQALVRTYFDNGKFFDLPSLLGKTEEEKVEIIETFIKGFDFIMDRYAVNVEKKKHDALDGIKDDPQKRYWVMSLFGLDGYEKGDPENTEIESQLVQQTDLHHLDDGEKLGKHYSVPKGILPEIKVSGDMPHFTMPYPSSVTQPKQQVTPLVPAANISINEKLPEPPATRISPDVALDSNQNTHQEVPIEVIDESVLDQLATLPEKDRDMLIERLKKSGLLEGDFRVEKLPGGGHLFSGGRIKKMNFN